MQSDGKTKDLLRRFFHVLVVSFSFLGTFLEPVLDTEDPKNQQTSRDPPRSITTTVPRTNIRRKRKKKRNCISLEEKKGGNREEGKRERKSN